MSIFSTCQKCICAVFLGACSTLALANPQILGVEFGESVESVHLKIDSIAQTVTELVPEKITFPLAELTEHHLVCSDLTLPSGDKVQQIVFSFADDRLALVTATGTGYDLLFDDSKTTSALANWDTNDDMSIIVDHDSKTTWFQSEQGVHPHVFLWNLHAQTESPKETSAFIPEALMFGSSYRTVSKSLKEMSRSTSKETISPPTLPTNPKRQIQLNCYGVEYAGAPRKLEAVFADSQLALVWILTAKEEEDRIRQALIKSFGQPIFTSDNIEAFDGWKIALRKDKPEVLAISDDLVHMMKTFFGG